MSQIPVRAGSPQTVSATAKDQKQIIGKSGTVAYANTDTSGTLTAGQSVTVENNTTLTVASGKGYVHVIDVVGSPDSVSAASLPPESELLELLPSVATTTEVFPLKRYGTVSTSLAADHTSLFEAFAEEVQGLSGQVGATLLLPPSAKLNIGGGVELVGRVTVNGQGARITSTDTEDTQAIFTAAASGTSEITLRDLAFVTDNTVLSVETAGNPVGLRAPVVERVVVVSTTALTSGYTDYGDGVADAFYFRNVDFARMKWVQIAGFNRGVVFDGDTGSSDRGNTQATLSELYLSYCRLPIDLSMLHLSDISADINHCGAGVIVRKQCKHLKFSHLNVQYFGEADWAWGGADGLDGYGVAVNMSSAQPSLVFDDCEVKVPQAGAVVGFGHYASAATYTNQRMPDPEYRSCRVDSAGAPGGFLSVDLWGRYTWRGEWPFTDTDSATHKQATATAVSNDGAVVPATAPTQSGNVLGFTRLIDTSDFSYSSGAGSLTSVTATSGSMPSGMDVTLNGVIAVGTDAVAVKAGWHTLLINAQSTSSDFVVCVDGASRYVQTRVSSYDTTNGQLYRIPFYVPSSTSIRLLCEGFAVGSKTATIGRFGIYRGLLTDFPTDPAPDDAYPSVASASTIARPRARTLRITGTTTVNTITAGYAGQELTIVASGLATFSDGGGNLALHGDWIPSQGGATLSLICNGTTWYETGRSQNQAAYATVASASTLAAPTAEVMSCTGTTTVTSVTAGRAGQRVTYVFTNALTFTDGSNLKLAGDFVTTADDSITLVCDGTNWIETGRSTN